MPFTAKQQEFLDNATHRWNIKEGATRSGKTYLDYFVIPLRIRRLIGQEGLVIILGNTRGTLQRNIIEPLQNMWGPELVSNIRVDNTAYMFGEKVYCLGADKANQVDRLRGSSIKYCYGDEVVTWSPEVFQMLKSRLDKPYSKFDGTCNPDSPNHWFYQFLKNETGEIDLYRQSYNIYDNEYLSETVVKNLEAEYSGSVYYDRYILGKWVRAEGIIYDTFTDNHIIENAEDRRYLRKWVSVDYGTQNATCFLLIGDTGDELIVIKEYYYSGRANIKQKTDHEYANDMQDFIRNNAIETIIVDPSAASFIAELRQRGLPTQKAENAVLDGIRKTSSAFGTNRLFVDKNCKNLISELQSYSWEEDTERPLKENDHACDSLRYGVMYQDRNLFVRFN
ncbi:MAG: PBSX family phage terminase large subunit [Abditibacteriota bacterium]|nr:PBSX family phage terminase large subunit [Abditibacteriota bacterium]